MIRLPLLLVVPAALLASPVNADFYSHRYGGVSVLNGQYDSFCADSNRLVANLNANNQSASVNGCNDQGSGWKLYGGWRWSPYLAIEADLRQQPTTDLSFAVSNPQLPRLTVSDKMALRMGNAFVVGHYPVGKSGFNLLGKLGGGFWFSEITEYQKGEAIVLVRLEDDSLQEFALPVSGKFKENDSGFHWGYGAGISYRHHNAWTLRAEWETFPEAGSAQYGVENTSLGWSMHF